MYFVTIPTKFVKADGKPFRRRKLDENGEYIKVKDSDGKFIDVKDPATGRVIGQQVELENASYLDELADFLNSLFAVAEAKAKEDKELKPLKLEDSSHATDVFRAIHVASTELELERATYEWLLRMLKTYGVDMFGINTALMLEPLNKAVEQTPSRAEERRSTK